MSYNYMSQRDFVFSEEGQRMFLEIRDEAQRLLREAGAVTSEKLMCTTGNTWDMLACMDRLVELKEIVEIPTLSRHRIFIRPYKE